MSKQYGLILPGNRKKEVPSKANNIQRNVFGNDSDSDDGLIPMRKTPVIGPGVNEKRQAKKIQEKALEEDPTIFQYDELYDEIEHKREQQKSDKNKEPRKAKYISRLLEYAERRKLENERRLERVIQKERELEGEEFKDKESFVTSAYRKKLEELKKAEEREKREDYLEAIGDVTKQQNLDGFYRHLYEQKLGPKCEETSISIDKKPEDLNKDLVDEQSSATSKIKSTKPRIYRKRRSSFEDEDEKLSEKTKISVKKAHLQSNLDADSDFSIDSSSEEENDKQQTKVSSSNEKLEKIEQEHKDGNVADVKIEKKDIEKENLVKKEENKNDLANSKSEEKLTIVTKENIWEKRTIGEVFDAALQRYYERKVARNG